MTDAGLKQSRGNIARDFSTVWHLLTSRDQGGDHAGRLENFYKGQAQHYDHFRKNFLTGRHELMGSCPWSEIKSWTDLGAGTGGLLEFVPNDTLSHLTVDLVDLSPSLLAQARQRCSGKSLTNVQCHQADVTTFGQSNSVDLVTFSYSLTMIPDWFKAIDNAHRILKPGGTIAVADFYVSRKYPHSHRQHHSWWTRTFWSLWFAMDNVNLNSEQLEYLSWRFTPSAVVESKTRVPFFMGAKVPVYRFLGQKS